MSLPFKKWPEIEPGRAVSQCVAGECVFMGISYWLRCTGVRMQVTQAINKTNTTRSSDAVARSFLDGVRESRILLPRQNVAGGRRLFESFGIVHTIVILMTNDDDCGHAGPIHSPTRCEHIEIDKNTLSIAIYMQCNSLSTREKKATTTTQRAPSPT